MQISEAEAQVMGVLWERHPQGADEVVAALRERTDWAEPTIKTLLNRLLNKGAIAADKDGRRYLYRPLLRRDDYLRAESSQLIDRLFEGRVAPLVSHFSAQGRLSAEDVAALRKIIEDFDHAG